MSRSRSRTRSKSPVRARSPMKSVSKSPVKKGRSISPPPQESSCPFLIRVFVTKGKHTHISDFDKGNFPLKDEFSAYGWKHTTPSQLISLLYPSFPPLHRQPAARFSFKHIYVDASPKGLYRSADLCSFTARDLLHALSTSVGNTEEGEKSIADKMDMELDDTPDEVQEGGKKGRKIDEKTLDDYGYVIGDILSVSVWVPEPKARALASLGAGERPGGESSFGWGDRAERGERGGVAPRGGFGRDGPGAAGREGWGRSGPLPPQDFAIRGNHAREEVAGGGSWRGGHSGPRGGGGRNRDRSRSPIPRDRASFSRDDRGRGRDERDSPPPQRRDSYGRR